ncbi:hypothetical protein [Pseudomonas amygdali]|nr:hypothetical protein [Pseudomonas amygdali]
MMWPRQWILNKEDNTRNFFLECPGLMIFRSELNLKYPAWRWHFWKRTMPHVTAFHAAEPRKHRRTARQAHISNRYAPRTSEDLTGYYSSEACYIAKSLGVPYRTVIICDHPCGELTIFVRQHGKLWWQGYLDFWFYEDMDNKRPMRQAMPLGDP